MSVVRFCCPRSMHGTPFEREDFLHRLREEGFEAGRMAEARIIVGSRTRPLLFDLASRPTRQALLWTNEPRCSGAYRSPVWPLVWRPRLEAMSVYTGDVFWHNLHFLGSYHFDTANSLGLDLREKMPLATEADLADRSPGACALFTYRLDRSMRFIVDGMDVDLERRRCEYAGHLHREGLCDIFGNNWPPHVSIRENSGYGFDRDTPWWTRKLALLGGYRFNLCLENTAAPYYCTEKIWHAIRGGTLPIYDSRGTMIYETFPEGSFIDLAQCPTPEALADFLRSLSVDEHLVRLNQCRQVYNEAIARRADTIRDDFPLHVEHVLRKLRRLA